MSRSLKSLIQSDHYPMIKKELSLVTAISARAMTLSLFHTLSVAC